MGPRERIGADSPIAACVAVSPPPHPQPRGTAGNTLVLIDVMPLQSGAIAVFPIQRGKMVRSAMPVAWASKRLPEESLGR